jgi:hypothetical protein
VDSQKQDIAWGNGGEAGTVDLPGHFAERRDVAAHHYKAFKRLVLHKQEREKIIQHVLCREAPG